MSQGVATFVPSVVGGGHTFPCHPSIAAGEVSAVQAHDSATKDDLRQLEARIDARFQAVNARFIAVDGRFATMGDRVNEVEQQTQSLARRFEARFRSLDNRLDATRTQIDHVRLQLSSQIDHARRDLGRIVLLGLVGTTVSTAGLCLGTIVLVI
jgi:hypothetical protein